MTAKKLTSIVGGSILLLADIVPAEAAEEPPPLHAAAGFRAGLTMPVRSCVDFYF